MRFAIGVSTLADLLCDAPAVPRFGHASSFIPRHFVYAVPILETGGETLTKGE